MNFARNLRRTRRYSNSWYSLRMKTSEIRFSDIIRTVRRRDLIRRRSRLRNLPSKSKAARSLRSLRRKARWMMTMNTMKTKRNLTSPQ